MSQNGNSPSQTSIAQAPSWQQPYQQYGLQQASAQYQNVNSPQQLVAGFSPQQNQAITGITNLATNNPTASAANTYTQNVLNGNPANNPYLNSEFQLGANQVQNQLDSEFAGAGRNIIGSAPVQADDLNNLATQLYGGAYNTGVQQQENALAAEPNTVGTDLGLNQSLFNTGQQVQNLAQNYIQAPQSFLNQYLSQVNGNLGSTSSTTYPLTTMQQLATAATGSSIGNTLGSALGTYLDGSTGGSVGGLIGSIGGAFL